MQERVACPLWGAPPQGPKTWVMEVVEITEVKNAGLMALVQGTIKVVLIIAGLIACRTRSSGRKCYITPAFSGIPKERGTKSK